MKSSRSVDTRRPRPVLGRPTYRAPRYQSNLGGRLIFLFLMVAIVGGVGAVSYGIWSLHRPQGSSPRRLTFDVGTGDTVTSIADRLQGEHLIDNALLFRVDARLHGLSAKLKVGQYTLRPNMSIDDMIAALTVYRSPTIAVTIPEGYRKEQIAAVLQHHGISGWSFLKEVLHPTVHSDILADKPAGADLEGYLFPSTYYVPPNYSGKAFADYMVHTLAQKFTPALRAKARHNGFSVYQTLALASIVERETPSPEERPLVAGVYANRLRLHMFMDADPTIQYGLGSRVRWTKNSTANPAIWWPVLTSQQEYQLPLAYNTYIHPGLPPGPIANPGLASIEAAANPRHTKYLYFVAKGNGHHAFAVTLTQQTANIAKYTQH